MIRQATQADFPTFLRLWLDYMQDQQEQGEPLLPTPKTIGFFTLLFSAYVSGARKGVVLLDEDRAVMLWGGGLAEAPFDTSHDPQARSWGVYVAPEHRGKGISRALYETAIKHLREMGFKTMTTGVLIGNSVGRSSLISEGFEFTHMTGALRIDETEGG
jgi:GNAT superfamily N-acetyltransferase